MGPQGPSNANKSSVKSHGKCKRDSRNWNVCIRGNGQNTLASLIVGNMTGPGAWLTSIAHIQVSSKSRIIPII